MQIAQVARIRKKGHREVFVEYLNEIASCKEEGSSASACGVSK